MNPDTPPTTPNSDEELDDPYIHTVSTEEFVETVERASQEENDDVLAPKED
ncbi:hypothetical protein [Spirosoma pollinicola]|uniref:hypothetical protein n=1 Tax=Spirosoma pollinicola TaxID=2057025 RepID=UPI001474F50F|nr:hypothetical protein [Spirosoma pollinicola]